MGDKIGNLYQDGAEKYLLANTRRNEEYAVKIWKTPEFCLPGC